MVNQLKLCMQPGWGICQNLSQIKRDFLNVIVEEVFHTALEYKRESRGVFEPPKY